VIIIWETKEETERVKSPNVLTALGGQELQRVLTKTENKSEKRFTEKRDRKFKRK